MNPSPQGFGFKLSMHLVAGLWFATTSVLWILIFVPWHKDRLKGRGIDMPWIVPRAIWRYAAELAHSGYRGYLPLVIISSIFGSVFLARVLYVRRLHSNLVAS